MIFRQTKKHFAMFKFSQRFLSYKRSPQCGDKVIVAMSGGVDSSVSAYLLKKQGYSVEGVYMRNWDTTDESGVCTSDQDWRDVQAVCKQLDIPCRHVDFTKEYWVKVFTKMIEDYENGFTPNPDIICNREIKFGLFLDKCLGSMFNAKWFATGHYVQVDHIHDRVKLLRGVDSTKDQSYFLSAVPEEKLKWAIFPVGKLYKTQVKSIASNANLITANKQESMGVCFIGKKKKFAEFLKQYLVTKPGDIKTIDGRIIGQHCGLFAYTIGQCAHINYGTNRWFVLKRNTKDNTLIVVPESNNPLLFSRSLVAKNWTWYFPPEKIKNDIKLLAQIRYHQSPVSCTVISRSNGRYFVEFETPQRAIAPGQVVVIWDNNWCLGSGVIEYAL